MSDLELWYDRPAREWTEALPIGNGRLGAMVFGGVGRERLQLNEDTLWAGGPYSPLNPDARPNLDAVRELVFAGRYTEAEALANRHLMARPLKQMPYQPAGDLWMNQDLLGEVSGYRRSLDLDSAVAATVFQCGAVTFSREVFASARDGVIVMRLRADQPARVTFALSLTSEQPGTSDAATGAVISWRGSNRGAEGIPGQLSFVMRAEVTAVGGTVSPLGSAIRVDQADEATITLDIATRFLRYDDVGGDPDRAIAERIAAINGKAWGALAAAHVKEHRRLFRRLKIELGRGALLAHADRVGKVADASVLPTDRRIAANATAPDPRLVALYVQYGRYLMMASSRPGTQPANLQGIWNGEIDPPWGSKYTTNINLQMNYWLADAANLVECADPLLQLAEDVSITGAVTARVHYGAGGWVLHHNTDLWRATAPIDGAQWGLWPAGGAWLCAQLWDHATFLGRPPVLVRRLHPLMAGAARFILDVLMPMPASGELVINPSLSPENVHPNGASICAGPAMDSQIIRDLFDSLLAASVQLGIEDALTAEVRRALVRLPSNRIGKAGQLQEWLGDWDMEAPEIHHRHVSHLYALYPSRQIDPDRTPELAAAARRSLEIRGDNATGWGLGWRINLWARLRDGDHAHDVLSLLLAPERTYPNMFDAHPPFQIDGNFGGAAGVLEMLVQSGDDMVLLLPALPTAWPDGWIRGVRARGGVEVDLAWENGALVDARLRCDSIKRVSVRYRDRIVSASLAPESEWQLPHPIPALGN